MNTTIILLYVFILIILLVITWFIISNELKRSNVKTIIQPVYKNLRVAVCISGNYRNNIECFEKMKHYLVDPLSADVFINISTDVPPEDQEKIHTILNPISISYQDYNINYTKWSYSKNLMNMITRMHDCNELKKTYERENNFIYDIVIRIRPDFFCKDYIPAHIINNVSEYVIYAYEFEVFPTIAYYGVSDVFFLGKSQTIDFAITSLLNTDFENFRKFCKLNEYLIYQVFISKGLSIKLFYIDGILLKFTLPENPSFDDQISVMKNAVSKYEGIVTHPYVCDAVNYLSSIAE